jgi:hypothetical protein
MGEISCLAAAVDRLSQQCVALPGVFAVVPLL